MDIIRYYLVPNSTVLKYWNKKYEYAAIQKYVYLLYIHLCNSILDFRALIVLELVNSWKTFGWLMPIAVRFLWPSLCFSFVLEKYWTNIESHIPWWFRAKYSILWTVIVALCHILNSDNKIDWIFFFPSLIWQSKNKQEWTVKVKALAWISRENLTLSNVRLHERE